MSQPRKTWQEKLADDKSLPRICKIDATKCKRWGEGTFVIPAPREVDAQMRKVPKGTSTHGFDGVARLRLGSTPP